MTSDEENGRGDSTRFALPKTDWVWLVQPPFENPGLLHWNGTRMGLLDVVTLKVDSSLQIPGHPNAC